MKMNDIEVVSSFVSAGQGQNLIDTKINRMQTKATNGISHRRRDGCLRYDFLKAGGRSEFETSLTA
jgi:hypothetical protein